MEIKKNQVINWREERKSEARYFANNPTFTSETLELINRGSSKVKESLKARLSVVQKNHYSSVSLFTQSGKEILSVGEPYLPEVIRNKFDSTHKLTEEWIEDMRLDSATGSLYLCMYAPLVAKIKNRDSLAAIMLFVIDPEKDLFPIVRTWPVKSESAEALLLKKEGGKVVTLVELKEKRNSALRYGLSLNMDDNVGVKAVKGSRGIYEGMDYRNIEVMAAAGYIPGTNWYLMTKIDKSEIYGTVYTYAFLIAIITIALITASGTSISLFARRREMASFRKQYQLEQEKLALKEHYEHLIRYANDIILLMDYNGKIIDVNEKAVKEYKYSKEELLSMNISDLRSPEFKDQIKSMNDSSNDNGLLYESAHRKKDGEKFDIEVSSRIIEVNSKKFIQNIIRDITERKLNELKIRKLNRVYALLSQINEIIIREKNIDQLFQMLCDISVETGEFLAVGIGLLNEKTNFLEVIASAGSTKVHFSNMNVPASSEGYGSGPIGSVLRDGKYSVVNDIENNPSFESWRNDALERGYRSIGSFPLKKEKRTIGAVMFYSADKNFFNEEEIRLLNEVVNNLSFAIETIEQDRQRKKIEEALQKTELNLRTLARNIPNTNIYIYNRNYEILISEGKELEDVKIKPQEFIQGDIPGLRLFNIRQKVQDVFSDRIYYNEVIIGNQVYFIQLHPVKNDSGDIIAGMVVLQNITESKKYESALSESESRLRGFFNLNNVYMALLEMKKDDICVIMANRKLAEFYNITTEDFKDKSVRLLEGDDFYYYWVDIYRNINKYKRPVSIEFSMNRHGRTYWFVAEISLIEPVLGGNPLYSYTAFDITERKIIENDLRKTEERFKSFFEADVIGLAFGDIFGNIQYCNDRFLDTVGYTREDFQRGKINWRTLTPSEYTQIDQKKLDEAKYKGHSDTYEKELIRKDGTHVKILIGFVLSGDKKEEVLAFIHKLIK